MRLKQAVVRSVLQQNATLLISFLSGLIIARLVTPAEFGSYSIAMAVLAVAGALRDFGVGSYVVSQKEVDEALLGAAYGLGLFLALLVAHAAWLVSYPLATFYGDPVLGDVLRIAALAGVATAAVLPAMTLLTRALRFDALLVAGVSGALAQAAVSIGLASLGFGASALGWGVLAGAAVTALVTLAYRPAESGVWPRMRDWGRLVGFGGLMSATLLVGSASAQAPQLIIGRMLGVGEAALFARAQNIVSVILNSFFFAVMRPLLPGLAQAEREQGDMTPLYLRTVACVTGLAWPAYALIAAWGDLLVGALYGQAWSAAGQMILPLAIAHGLTLAVAPHYDVMIVRRRVGLLLVSETTIFAVTAGALAVALWLKVPQPLWALTFGGLAFAVWYFVAIRSVLRFRASALIGVWMRGLVLAAACLPAPLLIRTIIEPDGALAVLACVAGSAVLSGVLWLLAARALDHELWRHIAPLLIRKRAVAAVPQRIGQ